MQTKAEALRGTTATATLSLVNIMASSLGSQLLNIKPNERREGQHTSLCAPLTDAHI